MFVCHLSIQGHWQTCGHAFASHPSLCCRCWRWSNSGDWDDRNGGWSWLSAWRSVSWSDFQTDAFISSSFLHYKRRRRWKRRNLSSSLAWASRAAPTGATMSRSGLRSIRPKACTRPYSLLMARIEDVACIALVHLGLYGSVRGDTSLESNWSKEAEHCS